MTKTIALFGGTGGIGLELKKKLDKKYNVLSLGSKDVNIVSKIEVEKFFEDNDCDIIINLSCYNYDSFLHKYTQEKQEELEKQLDVNVKGTVNIVSSCLKNMRHKKYGRIILASSILSEKVVPGTSIYSASKSFIESIARTCAIENINHNITCNSIQMGYFDGGLTYKIPENIREKIIQEIPSKRLGTIDELYNTIEFVINTPYINGTNIKINGGLCT